MYNSPSHKRMAAANRKRVPEGPIHDLWRVVENTTPDAWQKRTSALVTLVQLIPAGSEYNITQSWYNSPPILRHLANPLSELLLDPRSTVVKRTCDSLLELFQKCQADARYLLKDLMSAILSVHAQTVAVIRAAVQDMVVETLRVVPCKMTMPTWLERLKSDKSRTVREACALYLGVGLQEWTDAGYLTKEIWNQVSTSLARALRDPAHPVRQNAKRGLETVRAYQPEIIFQLMQNTTLTRDNRVKRMLERIQSGESAGDDNVSVASSRVGGASVTSTRSYSAFTSGRSVTGRDTSSRPTQNSHGNGHHSRPSHGNNNNNTSRSNLGRRSNGSTERVGIPANIAVSTPQKRVSRLASSSSGGLGPAVRMGRPASQGSSMRSAADSPSRSTPSSPRLSMDGLTSSPTVSKKQVKITLTSAGRNQSFDSTDEPDLPPIANKIDLKEQAAKRRSSSRRTSMLQQRILRSSSNLSNSMKNMSVSEPSEGAGDEDLLDDLLGTQQNEEAPAPLKSNGVTQDPEHWGIANEILDAHKSHVDQIMETLRLEMDALKDFEQLLLNDSTSRPNEDEVLDYFESVALCLDQRTTAGNALRKTLDRISKGTPSA